jgi:hypothetical protein
MYNNPAEKDSILNELAETPHTQKKGNFYSIVGCRYRYQAYALVSFSKSYLIFVANNDQIHNHIPIS